MQQAGAHKPAWEGIIGVILNFPENHPDRRLATIEAQIQSDIATAQLVRFSFPGPVDHIMRWADTYWLDLCLTPRLPGVRACYPEHWGPERFEPLGELFIVPALETLHARSDDQTTRELRQTTSMVCELDPGAVSRWFEGDLEWTEWRLEAGLDIADRGIRCMLMRMTQEAVHPGFASDALFELIAAQLAIELGRYCASIQDRPSKGGLAAWRLRLIDERLSVAGKAPTLAELAELCNLSVRQLSRGFRTSRGSSIGHYIEKSRVEIAKRQLLSGQPIKMIAYSMGFSSPSSFSYAFRRATGISPNHFRRFA